MDILGKSNRFSYLAAWGSIAYLAAEMVTEQKFALTLSGKYGTGKSIHLSISYPAFCDYVFIFSFTGHRPSVLCVSVRVCVNVLAHLSTKCSR